LPNTARKQQVDLEPRGTLASRALAMPADTNPMGDMFGGLIMSLMDGAGSMTATEYAKGRVVTVAVSNIEFLEPVKVGDTVCCYTDMERIGKTSLALNVEVWVLRQGQGDRVKVTNAEFTFVAEARIGEPLGKADADFVRAHTGFVIGGDPPVCHAGRLEIFIDADLLVYLEIWAAAGTPNTVFRLTPADLVRMTRGTVIDVIRP
jgi:acyl-CoA thioesterase YciA